MMNDEPVGGLSMRQPSLRLLREASNTCSTFFPLSNLSGDPEHFS